MDLINPLSKINTKPPSLSVIVVAVYDSTHLTRCLTALEDQIGSPNKEIIVVYHEGVDNIPALENKFTSVQFYCAEGEQTQAKMITLGIKKAHGRIVALTVDHCTAEEHWCSKIIELHTGPHAAVGGSLDIGIQPQTAVNWAVHLYDYCSYGYYQHPVKTGFARELSDCNVAYKREILLSMTNLWPDSFHVPLINRALLDAGESLWFSHDLLVYQNRDIRFGRAARIAYRRGRSFAIARMHNGAFSKRLFYMVSSPLLPLKLLGKLIKNIVPKRSHLGAMIRAFPYIASFATLWSCGELMGLFSRRSDTVIAVTEE